MRRASRSRALLSLLASMLVVAAGCGDDGSTGPRPDGGTPDADLGPSGIPWLDAGAPTLTPSPERECPTGFRAETSDTGVLTCRAYPETGPETCPLGQAHFPGGPGCEPVGTPCPADGWPTDLPMDRTIVYVRAGAIGGRGTTSSPHGTITRAIERSPDGAIIAVAPGIYDEQVLLDDDLSIRGACPAETILTLDQVSETSVVIGTFIPGTYAIENVGIRGDGSMAVFVQDGATIRLTDVVVEEAAGYGVYATGVGTRVDLNHVLVQNVARQPSGNGGIGIQYIEGATGTLDRVASVDNDEGHLFVAEDASATVTRFAGLGTEGGGAVDHSGVGLRFQDRVTVELSESAVWNVEGGGLFVGNASTVDVRDFESVSSGTGETLLASPALEVRVGSTVTVAGAHLEDALTTAVLVGEDAALTMRDAVLRDIRGPSAEADPSGMGFSIEAQAALTLERVLAEDMIRTGIVGMPETSLSLTDVAIRRVEARGGRNLGLGVSAFGEATLQRVVVEEATFVGITSSSPTSRMTLTDVAVIGTRSEPSDGLYGRGLEANLGARVNGERVAVVGNREVGLTAFDEGTRVMLDGFALVGTEPAACAEACGGNAAGYGTTIQNGAAVDLARFLVEDNAILGVQVGPGGSFTGRDGVIAGSPVGLNIQNPDFDLATSVENVEFRDLERNVDSAMLPLPPPGI